MAVDEALKIAKAAAGGEKFKPLNLRREMQDAGNPKRLLVDAKGPGGVKGIIVPRHMWDGSDHVTGMRELNEARANVYGRENRDPLTVGKIAEIHKQELEKHFNKPVPQQVADENAALARLRAAKHIGKTADTLDESEKLDTVNHEHDDQGRSYVAYGSKGVAGHALYTSGVGDNTKFHTLNTCPGQTTGCGGGVDKDGIVDTRRGTCFAPNAESQYPGAAVRRAAHAQAKHDPAMTRDWILAHTGSLRRAAAAADKKNKVVLFRPNIVDESDHSTRVVIKGLNKQRVAQGKPGIIANSYGKTNELHDPDNGYFVTYSNTGPKTKLGSSIAENMSRDKSRVRATITGTDAAGKNITNDEGNVTPLKNSYMVTDVHRYSPLDKEMQSTFKHAKYWSTGRPQKDLSPEETAEGPEGHFDGRGRPTTPDKAHYGHTTLNGKRFDYQKQHILHPRLVTVGKNPDGSDHMVPTDSRFKDDDYLPEDRFMTKTGKRAGAILLTTPTTSTNKAAHQSSFTHHVDEEHIAKAKQNGGEYEVDPPHEQEASAGREYVAPSAVKNYARGGSVGHNHEELEMAFPEQDGAAQLHLAHRHEGEKKEREKMPDLGTSISEATEKLVASIKRR